MIEFGDPVVLLIDPALRRHKFSLAGFISGDGMAASMQVKGTLYVNKKTLKLSGSYTTKKPNGDGWFDPGSFAGRMLVSFAGNRCAVSVRAVLTLLWSIAG